jgi:hypothetical protein
VTRAFARWTLLVGVLATAACGNDGPNPPGTVDCSSVAPTILTAGQFVILDASEQACVRIPGAASQEAEYLYVALSGDGTVSDTGTSPAYHLQSSAVPSAAVARLGRVPVRKTRPAAVAFHDMLRDRERAMTQQHPAAAVAGRTRASASVVPVPPVVGSVRTFDVCANTTCTSFVQSTATAKVVGQRVAIYLDDDAPAGFTQSDMDQVGALFDSHLYAIDTTAFGREPDLDNNGVVIVLLSQHVNDLSPDCNTTQSIVLGFFFGLDLFPSEDPVHSNDGEIFYGAVPRQDMPNCDAYTKDVVTQSLPGVFIHEFQHMISFNQHVLVRNSQVEETWLNEGLSHYAEELGGREVPDNLCPAFDQCAEQFLTDNVFNAYGYLNDPESTFLVAPSGSGGTLDERGAAWLFVRWLGDHFAATQPLAPELTRALVQTNRSGAANVEAATGADFPTLVAQWQLANYLTNLPGFTPSSDRLRYTGFDLRALYQANFPSPFGKPYPLTPDSTKNGIYDRTGVLPAGSGRHVRIIQTVGSGEVAFILTDGAGSIALAGNVAPRIALARVR